MGCTLRRTAAHRGVQLVCRGMGRKMGRHKWVAVWVAFVPALMGAAETIGHVCIIY